MEHSVANRGNIEIPVLRNHVAIEPYTKLAVYKAAAAPAVALKNAMVVGLQQADRTPTAQENHAAAGTADPAPKKKPRK